MLDVDLVPDVGLYSACPTPRLTAPQHDVDDAEQLPRGGHPRDPPPEPGRQLRVGAGHGTGGCPAHVTRNGRDAIVPQKHPNVPQNRPSGRLGAIAKWHSGVAGSNQPAAHTLDGNRWQRTPPGEAQVVSESWDK